MKTKTSVEINIRHCPICEGTDLKIDEGIKVKDYGAKFSITCIKCGSMLEAHSLSSLLDTWEKQKGTACPLCGANDWKHIPAHTLHGEGRAVKCQQCYFTVPVKAMSQYKTDSSFTPI